MGRWEGFTNFDHDESGGAMISSELMVIVFWLFFLTISDPLDGFNFNKLLSCHPQNPAEANNFWSNNVSMVDARLRARQFTGVPADGQWDATRVGSLRFPILGGEYPADK